MWLTARKVVVVAALCLGHAKAAFASTLGNCTPSAFDGLSLFGGSILNITTTSHANVSVAVPVEQNHYAKNVTGLIVCEVLITYTHPGYDDVIRTTIWLPAQADWSGRFLGAGGGGWRTGAENRTLAWAASEGFAVVTTDGGHAADAALDDWALSSVGNVNWIALQNFASRTLDDAATLGKAVVQAYYGKAPNYSFFSGCSTGGRQGHQMAQRYPDQYDGILASASAMSWAEMLLQEFWPQAVMNELGEYPTPCELDAIRTAVVEACDEIDGVKDGIISMPQKCTFDPISMVGNQYNCSLDGKLIKITETAATVAKSTWRGPTSPDGRFSWHGLAPGASFASDADTTCSNGMCTGVPLGYPTQWMKYFLAMDPAFDVSTVNISAALYLYHQSKNRYDSIIGTSDSDLSYFRDAGGKLITWHGLADSLIAPGTTLDYTQRVYERDPNATDYYRYFEAPGVDHCRGGNGWFPGNAMQSLIDWVENDIAPETLEAETQGTEVVRSTNLCQWPKEMVYIGSEPNDAASFECT